MEIRSMISETQIQGLSMTHKDRSKFGSFRFFHGGESVILHIDLSCAYLDFWVVNEKKRYLFGKRRGEKENRPIDPQTTVVSFDHTYDVITGMIGYSGLDSHCELTLDAKVLIRSIRGLCCGDHNCPEFALGITTKITVFLETARSDTIRNFVFFCLSSPERVKFGKRNVDEVHIWGMLSRYLVYWFERTQFVLGFYTFSTSTITEEVLISRVAYIFKTMGVLCCPTPMKTKAFLQDFEEEASKDGSCLSNYFEKIEVEEGAVEGYYRKVVETVFLDWKLNDTTKSRHPQSKRTQTQPTQDLEEESRTVYVTDLPKNVSVQQIWKTFKRFGKILHKGVHLEKMDTKCFAFVKFESYDGFKTALGASPLEIAGRRVTIEEKPSSTSGGVKE